MRIVFVLGLVCASVSASAAEPRKVDISITEHGFEPAKLSVQKGEETVLSFTRKTNKTCAKEVIIHVSDTEKIEKKLPLNQAVAVNVTFPKNGEFKYACGMNMDSGIILVE